MLGQTSASEEQISIQTRADQFVSGFQQDCESDNGKFHLNEGAVVYYDFNGDNQIDLGIVNLMHFSCSTSASLYQGSGGAMIKLLSEDDEQLILARNIDIVDNLNGYSTNAPVILYDTHGVGSGEPAFVPSWNAITLFNGRFIIGR